MFPLRLTADINRSSSWNLLTQSSGGLSLSDLNGSHCFKMRTIVSAARLSLPLEMFGTVVAKGRRAFTTQTTDSKNCFGSQWLLLFFCKMALFYYF
jgi:hypothetical protein